MFPKVRPLAPPTTDEAAFSALEAKTTPPPPPPPGPCSSFETAQMPLKSALPPIPPVAATVRPVSTPDAE